VQPGAQRMASGSRRCGEQRSSRTTRSSGRAPVTVMARGETPRRGAVVGPRAGPPDTKSRKPTAAFPCGRAARVCGRRAPRAAARARARLGLPTKGPFRPDRPQSEPTPRGACATATATATATAWRCRAAGTRSRASRSRPASTRRRSRRTWGTRACRRRSTGAATSRAGNEAEAAVLLDAFLGARADEWTVPPEQFWDGSRPCVRIGDEWIPRALVELLLATVGSDDDTSSLRIATGRVPFTFSSVPASFAHQVVATPGRRVGSAPTGSPST